MTEEQLKNYMTDRLNTFTLELSEHLAQTVQGAVKATVNGKIDNIAKSLSVYIEEDMEWKKRAEPSVRFFENVTFANDAVMWFLKLLAAIGIVVSMAYALLIWIKT
jgi:hypothetical protein